MGLLFAGVQDGYGEPLIGVGVDECLVSEALDAGQACTVLAVKLAEECFEALELLLLNSPVAFEVIEALIALVDLDLPGDCPGNIMIAGGEDDVSTFETQATNECLEKDECLLVFLRSCGFGDVARHDAEADTLLPAQVLSSFLDSFVEALGEDIQVLAFETAMGTKVEVGEVEDQQWPAHAPSFSRIGRCPAVVNTHTEGVGEAA